METQTFQKIDTDSRMIFDIRAQIWWEQTYHA